VGFLDEGRWRAEAQLPTDARGAFVRKESAFRDRVGSGGRFAIEPHRYHLYASFACPWAHRVLIARSILGLEDAIAVTIAHPVMGEDGWVFENGNPNFLWQVYTRANPSFTGRATVPVLWDRIHETIVNNESRELLRMFTTDFSPLHQKHHDLSPPELRSRIDETLDRIYAPINNGVYRAGFATTQDVYEAAVTELFDALDQWERVLARQRFLCGSQLTEADICLFTTLLRFDVVYATHFKCNVRRIVDYPNLWGFVRDVYQTPGVAKTCRFDHIKRHYFESHPSINPNRIVPVGPAIDFNQPVDRVRRQRPEVG